MNANSFRDRVRHHWRNNLRPFLLAGLVLFTVRSSLADWNDVPTGSMNPTIIEGDRIYINKVAYDLKFPFTTWRIAQWDNPQRGDIVVFYSPKDGTRLVKRVIGLPGDTLELRNEHLVINGNLVDYGPLNPKVSDQLPAATQQEGVFASEQLSDRAHAVMSLPGRPAMRDFGPSHVPAGHYFMMGDNRDNSFDSRYFGPVERKAILGRATAVALSFDRQNFWLPRWQRFFTSLCQ